MCSREEHIDPLKEQRAPYVVTGRAGVSQGRGHRSLGTVAAGPCPHRRVWVDTVP